MYEGKTAKLTAVCTLARTPHDTLASRGRVSASAIVSQAHSMCPQSTSTDSPLPMCCFFRFIIFFLLFFTLFDFNLLL